jgi:hypothetical protein
MRFTLLIMLGFLSLPAMAEDGKPRAVRSEQIILPRSPADSEDGILKSLSERVQRNEEGLKFRLYEAEEGRDGKKSRFEMKPEFEDERGLKFIFWF